MSPFRASTPLPHLELLLESLDRLAGNGRTSSAPTGLDDPTLNLLERAIDRVLDGVVEEEGEERHDGETGDGRGPGADARGEVGAGGEGFRGVLDDGVDGWAGSAVISEELKRRWGRKVRRS